MKAVFYGIALVTTLFFSNEISAQYGYGNGYGNGYGMNRRMAGGMDQPRQPDKPKEIPVEVTVSKIMERLTPDLSLDELQAIAISNIVTESIKEQGVLLKAEVSQEEKANNIKVLSETTNRKINDLLNADQKEKFKVLNSQPQGAKKAKNKKKAEQN
ncbi:hypothetical protein L1S34_06160 [Flavobacterium sp. K77]|uniref:hypothetical protein n=1 Tax=Flavobacterium sp. K77 TaxID=2910676 RepID=UPI001F25EB54|nr:hypothetical protein [Flavobacterium sp. K77]MCF6140865.1 hypothetical protein [Flavobacterium sp. K77]